MWRSLCSALALALCSSSTRRTGSAFGTSNIGVNYGIMFLGYAASTWISQPITAVLYHAEAGSAAYQQSFYGAIVIAAIAVVLTVYMMVSDSKKKSA